MKAEALNPKPYLKCRDLTPAIQKFWIQGKLLVLRVLEIRGG